MNGQPRVLSHRLHDSVRVPGSPQHPISFEAMDLRGRLDPGEGFVAKHCTDRCDRHDRTHSPVREVGQHAADVPVGTAVRAELGILAAIPRAMVRENAQIRPSADQGEHGVSASRVSDCADASGIDSRAELGIG